MEWPFHLQCLVKSFYAVTNFLTSFREGHYSVAKLILDSNAEVNVPSGSENNIPLTLACWKGVMFFFNVNYKPIESFDGECHNDQQSP